MSDNSSFSHLFQSTPAYRARERHDSEQQTLTNEEASQEQFQWSAFSESPKSQEYTVNLPCAPMPRPEYDPSSSATSLSHGIMSPPVHDPFSSATSLSHGIMSPPVHDPFSSATSLSHGIMSPPVHDPSSSIISPLPRGTYDDRKYERQPHPSEYVRPPSPPKRKPTDSQKPKPPKVRASREDPSYRSVQPTLPYSSIQLDFRQTTSNSHHYCEPCKGPCRSSKPITNPKNETTQEAASSTKSTSGSEKQTTTKEAVKMAVVENAVVEAPYIIEAVAKSALSSYNKGSLDFTEAKQQLVTSATSLLQTGAMTYLRSESSPQILRTITSAIDKCTLASVLPSQLQPLANAIGLSETKAILETIYTWYCGKGLSGVDACKQVFDTVGSSVFQHYGSGWGFFIGTMVGGGVGGGPGALVGASVGAWLGAKLGKSLWELIVQAIGCLIAYLKSLV